MCISNSFAFLCILRAKQVYHKYHLNHVLLLLFYILFILISAIAFFLVESQSSEAYRARWQRRLNEDRKRFITHKLFPNIFNNSKLLLYVHSEKSDYLQHVINSQLERYETHQLKVRAPMPKMPVTITNSIFFVFSTITTTGHGHIQPVTNNGRTISLLISLIGIPFTIIVIKTVAHLIAVLFHFPCKLLQSVWNIFRFCTLKPVNDTHLERELCNEKRSQDQDYRLDHANRLLGIPVTIVILSLIGWISIGTVLMSYKFEHLQVSHSVYFILYSITTTGVNNIDIGSDISLLTLSIYIIYILVGLSIVSLFINILHTKFSQAYWMPGRMYIPIRTELSKNMATIESFDEITVSDLPVNHMATLGILQVDDKCPLIAILKKDNAMQEAVTQTIQSSSQLHHQFPPSQPSPPPISLPAMNRKSVEDVNDLIIETYGTPILRNQQ